MDYYMFLVTDGLSPTNDVELPEIRSVGTLFIRFPLSSCPLCTVSPLSGFDCTYTRVQYT